MDKVDYRSCMTYYNNIGKWIMTVYYSGDFVRNEVREIENSTFCRLHEQGQYVACGKYFDATGSPVAKLLN